jgi:hypothetical protein
MHRTLYREWVFRVITEAGTTGRYSDSLLAGRSGDRKPVVVRFTPPHRMSLH